jgi:hypothetical protein
MVPADTLSQSQQENFDNLKLSCVPSSATVYDSLGCCTLSKHEIILDSRVPIFSHPCRKSIKERSILQDEVQKLLDAGIIRPSGIIRHISS